MKRAVLAAVLALSILIVPSFTGAVRADDLDASVSQTADAGKVVTPAGVPDPSAGEFEFAEWAFNRAMDRDWQALVAGLLVALLYVIRLAAKKVKWLAFLTTQRGGACLAMATSIVLAFATALAAGKHYSGAVLLQSVKIGFVAAGGWTVVRRILGMTSTSSDSVKA